MYDISGMNRIGDLEALVDDLNTVLSAKKVDPAVRKQCQETRAEALRKIQVLKKLHGL